jgi:hypothetical protein
MGVCSGWISTGGGSGGATLRRGGVLGMRFAGTIISPRGDGTLPVAARLLSVSTSFVAGCWTPGLVFNVSEFGAYFSNSCNCFACLSTARTVSQPIRALTSR